MKTLGRLIYKGEEDFQNLLEDSDQENTFPSMKYIYMEFTIGEYNENIEKREEIIHKFRKFLIALCPNLENPIHVNDDHSSKVIFESRLVIIFFNETI